MKSTRHSQIGKKSSGAGHANASVLHRRWAVAGWHGAELVPEAAGVPIHHLGPGAIARIVAGIRAPGREKEDVFKRLLGYWRFFLLRWRNVVSRERITGTADVVVSMTSCGERVRRVDVAVESIARGAVKPRRLILWLDDSEAVTGLSPALKRLKARGLEVRLSPKFGPHTKYFPYVASNGHSSSPLVTADDNVIYPSSWLEGLVEANHAQPGMIHGHWVCAISVNGGSMTGFQDWATRKDTQPGFNNFALGSSGVIYPPRMLHELKARGDLFLDVCPADDDIWLHWVALRAGIPVCQVDSVARQFPTIPRKAAGPGPRDSSRGGTDHWIRALYSAADVAALLTPRIH